MPSPQEKQQGQAAEPAKGGVTIGTLTFPAVPRAIEVLAGSDRKLTAEEFAKLNGESSKGFSSEEKSEVGRFVAEIKSGRGMTAGRTASGGAPSEDDMRSVFGVLAGPGESAQTERQIAGATARAEGRSQNEQVVVKAPPGWELVYAPDHVKVIPDPDAKKSAAKPSGAEIVNNRPTVRGEDSPPSPAELENAKTKAQQAIDAIRDDSRRPAEYEAAVRSAGARGALADLGITGRELGSAIRATLEKFSSLPEGSTASIEGAQGAVKVERLPTGRTSYTGQGVTERETVRLRFNDRHVITNVHAAMLEHRGSAGTVDVKAIAEFLNVGKK